MANETSESGAPKVTVGHATVIKKKDKKKRRYTRSLKMIGRAEPRITKVGQRFINAVSKGLAEYRKRADRSARKKRDGALRDMVANSRRGAGKSLMKIRKVPSEFMKIFRR